MIGKLRSGTTSSGFWLLKIHLLDTFAGVAEMCSILAVILPREPVKRRFVSEGI
jgi:hypothetical protein